MASLSDFYTPPNTQVPGFIQAGYDQQAGDATSNAGLSMSLAQRNFDTRTVPDLVNGQAGKAAFFSGATGNMVDRAKEDYTTGVGLTQNALSQTLAGLARNRILAGLGVTLP